MYQRFGKRWVDLILSALGLTLLSPVFACLALLVRRQHGAPVLFAQLRPGLRGKPFTLFKFRSMIERLDSRGSVLPDQERMTRFGCFLRSSSLDELPELWNVLRGDMSLVGPRPLLMQYLERYTPEQMRRHEVKPGITGLAQVNGRNATTWDRRFALDVWYVNHLSFSLDLKIILMTIWKVVKREGISQAGQATMEEFAGEQDPAQISGERG